MPLSQNINPDLVVVVLKQNSNKMACLNIFVVSLVLAVAFSFVQCSNGGIESNIEVLTVSDISDYQLKYPDVKVQPLKERILPRGASPYIQKQYTFGYRIQGKIHQLYFNHLKIIISSKTSH